MWVMRASEWEYRHQRLVHLLIVGVSFLTYLVERDDIVWALVRGRDDARLLERLLFAVATILIGTGAALITWAGAHAAPPGSRRRPPFLRTGPYRYLRYPQHEGTLLFAAGLGLLAPLWGFIVLLVGEAVAVSRLIGLERYMNRTESAGPVWPNVAQAVLSGGAFWEMAPLWSNAFRRESAKWGMFLTMIVFTALLQDRVAEILAVVSLLVWAFLNCGSFQQQKGA
jgi:protein-S-isoprenylcysteine O-methyltransferase Ste14